VVFSWNTINQSLGLSCSRPGRRYPWKHHGGLHALKYFDLSFVGNPKNYCYLSMLKRNTLQILFIVCRPLGSIYAVIMRLRSFLFTSNLLKRHTIKVPVVSVGNLTMGGSGKTPVVIYLARLFLKKGYTPAVVSRGYGGRATNAVNVVSDGATLYLDSIAAGDEPRLIAESVPGSIVVTGTRRVLPCRFAAEQLHCDVIILDDGFQHMHVKRDLDLVLFNSATLGRDMHVFPGGVLREPFSALARAHCLLFTGCSRDTAVTASSFGSFLNSRWPGISVFSSQYLPLRCRDSQGSLLSFADMPSPVFLFCGIATPQRFYTTVEQLPIIIAGHASFSDHHQYTAADLQKIDTLAQKKGACCLLTTEKDLVKLDTIYTTLPIFSLEMSVILSPAFDTFILESLTLPDKGSF